MKFCEARQQGQMAAPKKAAQEAGSLQQRSISQFFSKRPLPHTVGAEEDDAVVDLTLLSCADDQQEQIVVKEVAEEIVWLIDDLDPSQATSKTNISAPVRHSFFTRFEERVKRQEEKASGHISKAISEAPLFPSFLGTTHHYTLFKGKVLKSKEPTFRLDDYTSRAVPAGALFAPPWDPLGETPFPQERSYEDANKALKNILDRIRTKRKNSNGKPKRLFNCMEDDEDYWLPSGFRDFQRVSRLQEEHCEASLRHVYLLTGPPGTGKSHLARLLATELDAQLIEIGSTGGGPRGERVSKPFDDLLVAAEHGRITKERQLDEKGLVVVLIDEIDLLFEGDRAFIPALSSYVQRAPPKHIVVMTSNAQLSFLMLFYAFPLDLIVHEFNQSKDMKRKVPEGAVDLERVEAESWFDQLRRTDGLQFCPSELPACIDFTCERPQNDLNPVVQKTFSAYAENAVEAMRCIPKLSQFEWVVYGLPTWSLLERLQVAAEEERLITRKRRANRFNQTHSFIRGVPKDIVQLVINW